MTSFKPDYVPKAPSPNAITLGVRSSTYKFGGDTVHSIATFLKYLTSLTDLSLGEDLFLTSCQPTNASSFAFSVKNFS